MNAQITELQNKLISNVIVVEYMHIGERLAFFDNQVYRLTE